MSFSLYFHAVCITFMFFAAFCEQGGVKVRGGIRVGVLEQAGGSFSAGPGGGDKKQEIFKIPWKIK